MAVKGLNFQLYPLPSRYSHTHPTPLIINFTSFSSGPPCPISGPWLSIDSSFIWDILECVLRAVVSCCVFSVILGKSHYVLFFLVSAMQPRMLVTFDTELRPLPVTVRVGQVRKKRGIEGNRGEGKWTEGKGRERRTGMKKKKHARKENEGKEKGRENERTKENYVNDRETEW